MEFTIQTAKLNSILSKVSKGVGNGKILPITAYLQIELDEECLSITATNLSHFITCVEDGIKGTPGSAVIPAETLIKLVSKTTKEEISFKIEGDSLVIKGNGTYKLPMYSEEYPSYEFSGESDVVEIDTERFKKLLGINKCAIAQNFTVPCLTGYFISDKVITTDSVKMCVSNMKLPGMRLLIPQELVDLIMTITEPKIKIQHEDNKVYIQTKNIIILGTELDGINSYPDVTSVLKFEFEKVVTIGRNEIVNALERLSLFTDPLDNNAVKLEFKNSALIMSDIKGNSREMIAYAAKPECETGDIYSLNTDFLKALANSLEAQTIKLSFGNDVCIKLEDETTTMILSLMGN